MNTKGRILKTAVAVLGISFIPIGSTIVQAQSSGDRPLVPLTGVPPGPSLTEYYTIVQSPAVLVALGKALFWDTQVGKANGQACASCHYHAGADTRTVNQLSPGLKVQPTGDTSFGGTFVGASGTKKGVMGSGGVAGPNLQLTRADFPFHRLSDITDRESTVLFDTNDVTSSQGSFQGKSTGVAGDLDRCGSTPGMPFATGSGSGSLNMRKVEPRNTPTAINSAFNNRNFWDGRANNVFNGVNPFGRRGIAANPPARVYVTSGASVQPKILALENMSAASQAVGPVLSNFEMTCDGKTFPDLGRSMLSERALQYQQVAADDSVFSRMPSGSISPSGGLKQDYRTLIQQAFKPAYWNNAQNFIVDAPTGNVVVSTNPALGYRIDELNFSMFFGIAVDAYERTLISDQTPFDVGTMSDDARHGQDIFANKAKCATCHDGALFSKAAAVQGEPRFNPIDHMPMNNDPAAFADRGFFNTGVRPAFEDVGLGALDAFGNQLSFTRQLLGARAVDQFQVDPCRFEVAFDAANCNRLPSPAEAALQRIAVDGAFKTPGLRNVALTAPYMHNGGQKSLDEVVEFYSRGGDRRSLLVPGATNAVADHRGGGGGGSGGGKGGGGEGSGSGSDGIDSDSTGTGLLGQSKPVSPKMGGSNVHPEIKPFSLNPTQKMQMVEFLKSLTDPRVACHAAPFDHPALTVANGQTSVDANGDGNADDKTLIISAVGAGGYATCKANYDALNSGDLFTSSAAFTKLK